MFGNHYFGMALTFFVGASLCAGFACGRSGSRPSVSADGLQTIYVDESGLEQQSAGERGTLRVQVTGSLPSPAYKFQKFEISVSEDTVIVTPLAKADQSRMVAQMLVPFSEVCVVPNLKPGTYQVKVAGRAQSVYVGEATVE